MCRGSHGRASKDPSTPRSTPILRIEGALPLSCRGMRENRKEDDLAGNAVSGPWLSPPDGSRMMAWKARVRWRRLRGELEGAMADSFRSQGRQVGLRLAPRRVDAIGGGLMSDDAWQYYPNPFISFSLASCTAVPSGGLRGTMQMVRTARRSRRPPNLPVIWIYICACCCGSDH